MSGLLERTDDCGKKWEQSGWPRGAVQMPGDIEGLQSQQGPGWLGRRKTLSPGAEGSRTGVGAGSGSVSKRMPLLGARVSVLCPGSRRGLGEFDGGIGAQIPGERRRSRDESALRCPSLSCQLGLDQGSPLPERMLIPKENAPPLGACPSPWELAPLLTCHGTTPWGGRSWGWCHCR